MWTKKIEIKDENHLREVVKALESLGENVHNIILARGDVKSFWWYDDIDNCWYFSYNSIHSEYWSDCKNVPEFEIITKTSYELKEVVKREIIKIGDKEYYKDELEIALKNIKPI